MMMLVYVKKFFWTKDFDDFHPSCFFHGLGFLLVLPLSPPLSDFLDRINMIGLCIIKQNCFKNFFGHVCVWFGF